MKELKIRLDPKTLVKVQEITKEFHINQAQFVRFAINGLLALEGKISR